MGKNGPNATFNLFFLGWVGLGGEFVGFIITFRCFLTQHSLKSQTPYLCYFLDRVGYRLLLYFLDRVGYRSLHYFLDRDGYRPLRYFLDRIGYRPLRYP